MKELFIHKSITINKTSDVVWRILTKQKCTDQWTPAFAGKDDPITIESDWKAESRVFWKNKKGEVVVEGNVTKHTVQKQLQFTVMATGEEPSDDLPTTIEFTLEKIKEGTILTVNQGDFAQITGGDEHYKYMQDVWDDILGKIKSLAEK